MPPFQTTLTGLVVAIVGFFSSFPIVLEGLTAMGASPDQAAAGLMAAAFAMGIAGIGLSLWLRMPVSVAWSTPGAALLAVSVAPQGGFSEAVGGFIVAALLVVVAGLWRPLGRLAAAIPSGIAQAMLAGVLLPICLIPVQAVPVIPQFILPIFAAWVVVGLIHRLAAVPAAVLMTAILIVALGDIASFDPPSIVTAPILTLPSFSLATAVGIGIPLFIVTMATQNIPGIAILRSFDYTPAPGPMLTAVGGISVISAPFGAFGTCLAAITAAMCAGEDSHPDRDKRYWSAVMGGVFYCGFGLFAGLLTSFAALAPPLVMSSLAGLALIGVLAGSLQAALEDKTGRDAAILTFVVTASGVTLFGLGAAVWGLLAGVVIHLIRRVRPVG